MPHVAFEPWKFGNPETLEPRTLPYETTLVRGKFGRVNLKYAGNMLESSLKR